jgi:hypothetical protein
MENLTEQLKKDMKSIIGEFKTDDDMMEILKKRLTKKEFKFYRLRCINKSEDELMAELRCDAQRLEDIQKQTILKLNQEKLKNELMG